ncbi:CPBP family intramembrane glutamic endopeptidase [Devosia sp. SL43]|uniref:CPBP family intramembrane glutamic endopeptidase n=1 Tax=Devosia sp. SL43 TaxID=2806348 RepID=UPI001F198C2A|nr:CPBP family intramembrane glutamic endopeptidase [Devosia sp. SL43]UJW84276.1 CPBP family intramembrane metalloprotease [Devosia sp. SL43]
MNRSQSTLVLHALVVIAALLLLVPALTQALGGQLGYLLSLTVYWLGFCIPVIALHSWKRHDGRLFSEKLAWRDWWVPLLLLLQVVAIGIAAFFQNTTHLTTRGAMLAAAIAIINAPLEEAAWRGGFMVRFVDKPRLGFWLGWLLFTAWHIPLALSHGVAFDGGWVSLVGGAAALGLLWSWIAWRTGSVFWVAIAHVLTNVLTFWVFFDRNGFV